MCSSMIYAPLYIMEVVLAVVQDIVSKYWVGAECPIVVGALSYIGEVVSAR